VDLFLEYSNDFSAAEQALDTKEETARYVIRYCITFGNFYYDRLFVDEENEDFDENFNTAFRSYNDAIVYARNHAESSGKFTQEVFAERIRELLKAKEIHQKLRDELLRDWQERQLDTIELHRYLDF
jgi:hypothetical protein